MSGLFNRAKLRTAEKELTCAKEVIDTMTARIIEMIKNEEASSAEIAALKEENQKLRSNLNERMPAHDRPELICKCTNPAPQTNRSSDHGHTEICYNCIGWVK